jgi:hypothetical protein
VRTVQYCADLAVVRRRPAENGTEHAAARSAAQVQKTEEASLTRWWTSASARPRGLASIPESGVPSGNLKVRPIAQGVLSGLVAIPVEIHRATKGQNGSFNRLYANADRASVTRYFVLHARSS